MLNAGSRSYVCFASWDDKAVQRTGGWSIDWGARLHWAQVLSGPPLTLLLIGLVVQWVARLPRCVMNCCCSQLTSQIRIADAMSYAI
jgi:hypothetical protein